MSAITAALKAKFDVIVARYPTEQRQSAVIPLLHLAQADNGGQLTQEHQQEIAEYLGVPMSKVHEVTTFYTMYSLEPRGRVHVAVCRTLPCELTGCGGVINAVKKHLGVAPKEVTADGKYSYEEVECLAHCHIGPVMQIGEDFYGNLTPASAIAIIESLGKKAL